MSLLRKHIWRTKSQTFLCKTITAPQFLKIYKTILLRIYIFFMTNQVEARIWEMGSLCVYLLSRGLRTGCTWVNWPHTTTDRTPLQAAAGMLSTWVFSTTGFRKNRCWEQKAGLSCWWQLLPRRQESRKGITRCESLGRTRRVRWQYNSGEDGEYQVILRRQKTKRWGGL